MQIQKQFLYAHVSQMQSLRYMQAKYNELMYAMDLYPNRYMHINAGTCVLRMFASNALIHACHRCVLVRNEQSAAHKLRKAWRLSLPIIQPCHTTSCIRQRGNQKTNIQNLVKQFVTPYTTIKHYYSKATVNE